MNTKKTITLSLILLTAICLNGCTKNDGANTNNNTANDSPMNRENTVQKVNPENVELGTEKDPAMQPPVNNQ